MAESCREVHGVCTRHTANNPDCTVYHPTLPSEEVQS